MDRRILLAWLHLVALALGASGLWTRARALRDVARDVADETALRRAYSGDLWWGIAALLWIATGAWRLLAGTEKATGYYLANGAFRTKMALLVAILVLEVFAMRVLVRWRRRRAVPSARAASGVATVSVVQGALLALMMLAAVRMARGYDLVVEPVAAPSPAPVVAAPAAPLAPIAPSGTDVVTPEDVALLAREIAMPIDGVDPATLHSGFDDRRGGGTRRHQALDIMAPRRTPVHAAADGRVLRLFTSVAGGLMVYAADSSERFIMMYGHLDGYAAGLRQGQRVARGQVIGYVGSTGNASANEPHLHFALARSADVKRWSRGRPVDPLPVLRAASQLSGSPGRE